MSTIASGLNHYSSQKLSVIFSMIKLFFGIFLIIACSNITIPLKPVPITLQTAAVMLIGLLYKPQEAAIVCTSYLSLGILGAPVFAGFASGFEKISGYTGGYLVGMAVAGYVIAYMKLQLSSRFKPFLTNVVSCGIGSIIVFAFGVGWLSTFIGIEKAIYTGFIIFIPSGICKMLLVSYILKLVENKQQTI